MLGQISRLVDTLTPELLLTPEPAHRPVIWRSTPNHCWEASWLQPVECVWHLFRALSARCQVPNESQHEPPHSTRASAEAQLGALQTVAEAVEAEAEVALAHTWDLSAGSCRCRLQAGHAR